jgi:hypothetical protein
MPQTLTLPWGKNEHTREEGEQIKAYLGRGQGWGQAGLLSAKAVENKKTTLESGPAWERSLPQSLGVEMVGRTFSAPRAAVLAQAFMPDQGSNS